MLSLPWTLLVCLATALLSSFPFLVCFSVPSLTICNSYLTKLSSTVFRILLVFLLVYRAYYSFTSLFYMVSFTRSPFIISVILRITLSLSTMLHLESHLSPVLWPFLVSLVVVLLLPLSMAPLCSFHLFFYFSRFLFFCSLCLCYARSQQFHKMLLHPIFCFTVSYLFLLFLMYFQTFLSFKFLYLLCFFLHYFLFFWSLHLFLYISLTLRNSSLVILVFSST